METKGINFSGFCLALILLLFSTSAFADEHTLTVTPLLKKDHAVYKKQRSETAVPKKILYWKQIAPYVVMQKVCDDEKIILLYSEMKDIHIGTALWDIYPREVTMLYQLTRKNSTIDSVISDQMIYRYVFCIEDSIQSFVIKNNEYESTLVDLKSQELSHSRNLGLVLDADKDYIALKAESIEQAETQRSKSLEYLQPAIAGMVDNYYDSYSNYGNAQYDYTYVNDISTNTSTNDSRYPDRNGTTQKSETAGPSSGAISSGNGKNANNGVTSTQAKSIVISTIEDENIIFDESKIILGGSGNGYTVQIIAKLKHDHTEKTIQQYYNLPFDVQEHFDGTWHRFTLKGYLSDWDEAYGKLQDIRKIYGISDAFISLYQNHERVAIYPCSEDLAEYPSEYAENLEIDNK